MENALVYGHRPRLLLACDSESDDSLALARSALEEIAASSGLQYAVTDLPRRWRFVEGMRGALNPQVLEYGLIPNDRFADQMQVGTNLNAILLSTAGSCVVSTDDDGFAKPARLPGSAESGV